jgi:O-glycosyl hydrolase
MGTGLPFLLFSQQFVFFGMGPASTSMVTYKKWNHLAQSPIQFTVDISKQAQKIIGFGGAITDSAVINFFNLSAAAQTNLINAYYGDAGMRFQKKLQKFSFSAGFWAEKSALGCQENFFSTWNHFQSIPRL